jgi:peptidyl-dipeptidase A
MKYQASTLLLIVCSLLSCQTSKEINIVQEQAQSFLDSYNGMFRRLATADNLAQWNLNTRIVKGDTMAQYQAGLADKAFAKFTGSRENIDSAKKYLALQAQLTPLQFRQFQVILYNAGNNPEIAGDKVDKRIKIGNELTSLLYGSKFYINKKPIPIGSIDSILENSLDLSLRLKAWESSKEIGKGLKTDLDSFRNLLNENVTPLGYKNFFDYTSEGYEMTGEQMVELTQSFIKDIWPLYREIHTWARYDLAAKYHQPIPDFIPAQWLPDRWGQSWNQLAKIESLSIDSVLKTHSAEWIAHQSEDFYVSLGFDSLPKSFWKNSSLYPVPLDSPFTKNNHASAWHIDLDSDVRSLESITPTTEYWSTVLHEFGHIYYFISYTNSQVPYVLRIGANSGFHEAFGTMIGMASLQKPLLENRGLIPKGLVVDDTLKLLNEALNSIVFIPWSAGVMTEFEYNLYAKNLPENQFNKLWWELVKKYQGIVPPVVRGEEYCDAASKTHITNTPAYYYNYSIASVLQFQFHQFIADSILHEDPHATNYWGQKAVGDFLKKVMQPGASIPWKENLQENIHSELSAKAMMEYFGPLLEYLKRINKGRKYTLPENFNEH